MQSIETSKTTRTRWTKRWPLAVPLALAALAGCDAGGAPGEQGPAPAPSVIQMDGELVEMLPTGEAIRKDAKLYGQSFRWQRKVIVRGDAFKPEKPPIPSAADATAEDEEKAGEDTEAQLALKLQRRALYQGHEYLEDLPIERARAVLSARRAAKAGQLPEEASVRRTGFVGSAGGPIVDELTKKEVIGTDTRTACDTSTYPCRTNIVLDNTNTSAGINASEGTATLVAASTAVSAAHVFWDEDANTWEPDYNWAPGFDSTRSSDTSPWGNWFRCYIVTIPNAYTTNETHSNDYAVIDFNVGCNIVRNGVNSDRPGATVGWLGVSVESASAIQDRTMFVRGYPGAGTCGSSGSSCGVRVWWSSSSVNVVTNQLRYSLDTSGGQSGSGAYVMFGDDRYVVGIHRAGVDTYNLARRVDDTVMSFIRSGSDDL